MLLNEPTAALRLVASGFGPIYIGVGFGAVAGLRLQGEPEGAGFVVASERRDTHVVSHAVSSRRARRECAGRRG